MILAKANGLDRWQNPCRQHGGDLSIAPTAASIREASSDDDRIIEQLPRMLTSQSASNNSAGVKGNSSSPMRQGKICGLSAAIGAPCPPELGAELPDHESHDLWIARWRLQGTFLARALAA